jgi:SWI/SNF-related matrix-associated actin-dependent regulator 1 of chromatin subfamily A
MQLFPFQKEGVNLIEKKFRGRVLLADDMGCLTGDSIIKVSRAGKAFSISLSHLHYKFHNGIDGRLGWDNSIVSHTRSIIDGRLRLNRIVNVLDSGMKEVIEVTLQSGKQIKLTPDHELLTPNGDIAASALSVGAEVYVSDTLQSTPRIERIISVKTVGIEPTYDLVMAEPGRNFVANGICVHNCGKTIQAVTWLKKKSTALPAIIVCPASVKSGWEEAFKSLAGIHPMLLEGETPQHASLRSTDVIIVNYDIVEYRLDELMRFNPATLVLDEAQNCTNRFTHRTKACKILSRQCRYMLALSGTPMTNRPAELWPVLNMLFPKDFNSFWSFGQRYCSPKLTPWGWQFKGATNIKELNAILRDKYMIRRRKSEVMHEMPQKIRNIVHIKLQSPEEYAFAERDYIGWLRRNERHKVKKAKKAMKVSRFSFLRRFAARQKLRGVVRWINHWLAQNPTKKLVVFGWHTKMITAIARRIDVKSVVIVGNVPQHERKKLLKQFREDDKTRVLIGNMGAVGTGLDGMQIASDAAIVELDLRPGVVLQVEDRLHRIGQESLTNIYYLLGEGTIEIPLCELLQKKQEVISSTLDGGKQLGDFDLFDELMSILV